MLKSSKWAPWQPPQDYLDSLAQRAASSQVAGEAPLLGAMVKKPNVQFLEYQARETHAYQSSVQSRFLLRHSTGHRPSHVRGMAGCMLLCQKLVAFKPESWLRLGSLVLLLCIV